MRRYGWIGCAGALLLACGGSSTPRADAGGEPDARPSRPETGPMPPPPPAVDGGPCRVGETDCAGACRDLQADPLACGACGVRCGAGQVCERGACLPVDCGGGTRCGEQCADLSSDPQHCGACNVVCAPGQACAFGVCACGPRSTRCLDGCADLVSDPRHCGSCDNVCLPGQACVAGSCGCECSSGRVSCGAECCIDLQSDPRHCGSCGHECCPGTVCVAGGCAVSCPASLILCGDPDGGDCGGFACVDPQADPANCGACGHACAGGSLCTAGVCDCGSRVDCDPSPEGFDCRDPATDPCPSATPDAG